MSYGTYRRGISTSKRAQATPNSLFFNDSFPKTAEIHPVVAERPRLVEWRKNSGSKSISHSPPPNPGNPKNPMNPSPDKPTHTFW